MQRDYYQKHLLPCDMESPFIFVSYSSADAETVHRDVCEMQRRRFNIWIDDANLDKRKPSWKEDALKAIRSCNCRMVVFYVSSSSLVSEPCLRELDTTRAGEVLELNVGKPIPLVLVEAEPIGHIRVFADELRDRISLLDEPTDKKEGLLRCLFHMTRDFVPLDNEKVRILPVSDTRRLKEYYTDLERSLHGAGRQARTSIYRVYRRALDYAILGDLIRAEALLEPVSSHYPPAALLLAHLYLTNGILSEARKMAADRLWKEADQVMSAFRWRDQGKAMTEARMYSEALAYYLGDGEYRDRGESLYEASKIFLRKGDRRSAIACLNRAAARGYPVQPRFIRLLHTVPEEEIRKKAYKDEAPVH